MKSIVSDVSLETDNVDGDESNDDELPSLQKLLPPATQAPQALQTHQANLEVS